MFVLIKGKRTKQNLIFNSDKVSFLIMSLFPREKETGRGKIIPRPTNTYEH